MSEMRVDLCVIGAGSGGLSVAAAASQMGVKVVLVEKSKMGGDCLNYGCIPSKSILAAAKHINTRRLVGNFGIQRANIVSDFKAIQNYIQHVISQIAPHDSEERFKKLGVTVIREKAKFINSAKIKAGEFLVAAKYFVIATGSSPFIPPIKGLENVEYLTNESIFNLNVLPPKLLIIGGGPIGCEMAQAFASLGSEVVLLELGSTMIKDDQDMVAVVRKQLQLSGVKVLENASIQSLRKNKNQIETLINHSDKQIKIISTHLLIATGRCANVENLGLDKIGVQYSEKGITVDRRLRTRKKHIFAIGDAIGELQFTHVANYHAGIVIRNILFKIPTKVNYNAIPWVTYTDPELAHVGLNENMAKKKNIAYKVLSASYKDNDRAYTESQTDGKIKLLISKKEKLLGVTIVGAVAGELIMPWCLMISKKLPLSAMASLTVAYPTLSEINKRVASAYFTPKLYSNSVKKIVRFLMRF